MENNSQNNAKVTINLSKQIGTINPNLYGHFTEHLGSCVYEGIWVGPESSIPNTNGIRTDVVEALKKIHPPIVRWPGGCFADDYHWKDGIGPKEHRKVRINRWWNSIEDNQFGTHEFFEFCEQIGCEPYICGNVGSGTIQEMSEWLEYLNCDLDTTLVKQRAENSHPEPFGVRYWGIGNENWGCGGNMSPQYYANEYRRYSTYCSSYNSIFPLYRIACGANSFDYGWTEKFFAGISGQTCKCSNKLGNVDGYAFHYYCGTSGKSATEFNEMEYYALLMRAMVMEELIEEHRKIMDKYDPKRRIGLICDEWGTWHPAMEGTDPKHLKQQNTIRDAIVAALTLDIFNRNADKIVMANIAQTINVLQSMILTNGAEMITTPTYHVYDMYQAHQGAIAVVMDIECDVIDTIMIEKIHGSASKVGKNIILSLVNIDAHDSVKVELNLRNTATDLNSTIETYKLLEWRYLGGCDIHEHNTFECPDRVVPHSKNLSDSEEGQKFTLQLPKASINIFIFNIL